MAVVRGQFQQTREMSSIRFSLVKTVVPRCNPSHHREMRESIYSSYLLISSILFCLIMAGCSFISDPPVYNGLYLKYWDGTSNGCRISFEEIDGNLFSVTMSPSSGTFLPDGYYNKELIVNKYLKSAKGRLLIWGEAIQLWLPAGSRKVGARPPGGGMDDITEVKRWKEWEVAVINAKVAGGFLQGTWYYDVETGFIVGYEKTFAGETNLILLLEETNAGAEL